MICYAKFKCNSHPDPDQRFHFHKLECPRSRAFLQLILGSNLEVRKVHEATLNGDFTPLTTKDFWKCTLGGFPSKQWQCRHEHSLLDFLKKWDVLCFTKFGWWNSRDSRAVFLQCQAFMVAVAMAMFLRRTSYPNAPRVQWVRGCDEHCWHFPLRPRSRVKNLVVGTLSMGCLTKNSLRIASHFEKDGELLARGACWKVQILSNQMYSSLMMSLRQVHNNKYCN